MANTLPDLYTLREVAEHCKVSVSTVERWVKSGRLVANKWERTVRVRADRLQEFLDQTQAGSGAEVIELATAKQRKRKGPAPVRVPNRRPARMIGSGGLAARLT